MKMNVLFIGPSEYIDTLKGEFKERCDLITVTNYGGIIEQIKYANAIIDASVLFPFTSDVLVKASVLKLFICASTNSSHVDVEYLINNNIKLFTLSGNPIIKNVTSSAEHSWLLLMSCARNLCNAVSHVKKGKWERDRYPGVVLKNKTLGIIGFGRNGRFVAKYARAFDMNILVYDPYVSEWYQDIKKTGLNELLGSSDFISLYLPFNNETEHMINGETISQMKNGVIVINTSNGKIIDEFALIENLESGKIKCAGLDVLSNENDIENNIVVKYASTHNNLIVTPHIAGYCPEVLNNILVYLSNYVMEFFGVK